MALLKAMKTDSTLVSISVVVAVDTHSRFARFHTVNRIGSEAGRRHASPK